MRLLKTRAFRWLWRSVLLTVLLLLAAGAIAPFVNASFFAPHIQRALEASLNRKVKFDEVHLSVFSGPGFSLSNVSIEEDPRFGFEPFASVPTLQAGLRIGTLLKGHVAFSSLHLIHPSLNLVKRSDGAWNAVELLGRLTTESSLPIDLFPVFSVSGARIDVKFGERKTTTYIADTDVSVYPQRSSKLYVRFSGAPARTDRPGYGFGHLHGAVNWYRIPASATANQLEADISLDASNLSEISTLFEGQDAGVHGTVASHARIEGPLNAIRVQGDLTLQDVHRWDLLPLESADWKTHYSGEIDSVDQSIVLRTVPANGANSVTFQLRATKFLTEPAWSVLANLNDAPAIDLLPLGRRMGLPLPADFKIDGKVAGAIGYSNAVGLSGSVELRRLTASMPNVPSLRTDSLLAQISNEGVKFEPTEVQTDENGSMLVGGEYDFAPRRTTVSVQPKDFSIAALRGTVGDWFGTPDALDIVASGTVSGRLDFLHAGDDPAQWSGQVNFHSAQLRGKGLAEPLKKSRGQLRFDADSLDLERSSGEFGADAISMSYHATRAAPDRVHIYVDAADLHDIETALAPAMRPDGVFERLGVTARKLPAWLADRHLQGDITIQHFSINGVALGALRTRVIWNGAILRFPSLALQLPDGSMQAEGTLDLTTTRPDYQFTGSLSDLHWHGGTVDADGTLRTSGFGADAVQRLRAEGTFTGEDVAPSPDDAFDKVSGTFVLTFAEGWPDLKIQQLEASERDEDWIGSASSRDDGKLIIDLEREGHQRHVTSALQTPPAAISSAMQPQAFTAGYSGKAVR